MNVFAIVVFILVELSHYRVNCASIGRHKRFILQSDTGTQFPFPVPTTYPVPTLRNGQPVTALTPSTRQSNTVQLSGHDLLNSVKVTCTMKRSADFRRIILDETLMEELYLTLVGNIDTAVMARSYKEAVNHFQHRPSLKARKRDLTEFSPTTVSVRNDVERLQGWIESVLSSVYNNLPKEKLNQTESGPTLPQTLMDMLQKLDLTMSQLKQVLGLSNDVEDIMDLYVDKSDRIRRSTSGSSSRVEYCHKRGSPTGTGYIHMCSTCALTTQLSDDVFPRFIQEADCDASDCNCFIVSGTPHGKCQSMVRTMKILKKKPGSCRLVIYNGQQLIVDDWELIDHHIKVGCECLFNKNSLFASFIAGN